MVLAEHSHKPPKTSRWYSNDIHIMSNFDEVYVLLYFYSKMVYKLHIVMF